MLMGTVGYMAPEQVRGLEADHRSDVFAFGVILYEMLAGQRAFQRETMAETMTAILKEDPPELSEANKRVGPRLEKIVQRCLEKEPERRFHSAHDLAFAIEASFTTSSSQQTAILPPVTESEAGVGKLRLFGNARLAWIVAGVFLWAAHGPALRRVITRARRRSASRPFASSRSPRKRRLTLISRQTECSADGSRVAFVATTDGRETALGAWI